MRSTVWMIAVLLVLGIAGYWLGGSGVLDGPGEAPGDVVPLEPDGECILDADGCAYRVEGRPLRIRAQDSIRTLEPFPVYIDGSVALTAAQVVFTMEGMDMGLNLFRFEQADAGMWRTTATLPVCTADRADWLATFTLETGNGLFRATVPFSAR